MSPVFPNMMLAQARDLRLVCSFPAVPSYIHCISLPEV